MNKYVLIAVLALALAIVVVACAPAPTATPVPPTAVAPTAAAPKVEPTKAAAAGPQVLRIARSTYPDVLDPQKSSYGIEIEVLKLCYEGMTALDNKGNIGPGSADKWTIAPDGKSITFHIREGLKRADGTALNASDFEYALKRSVDPKVTGKQYADIMSDIKGSHDLIAKEGEKLSDADYKKLYDAFGVKADDSKREVTVSFEDVAPYWTYVAYIWETYVPDKKKVDAAPDNWWNKADGHNCYGPFKIKSIEEGKRIVYEANPNYWRGKPKLDRIEVTYIVDEVQRFEAYKKDEFDLTDVGPAVLKQVEADAKLKAEFVRYALATTRGFQFNLTRKPMDDKNVRVAFSQAWDRKAWVRDVLNGIGVAAYRWLPPGVPGNKADQPGSPAYDPKASVETLLKNGYATADGKKVDCAKLGEIKLTYSARPANHPRWQWLAGLFASAWGCPVTIDPVDPTVYTALTKDVKTMPLVGYGGWIQDYPHPQNWLSVFWKCGAFAKRYGYCNKDNDALMSKADATVDFEAAVKMYQQAEDTIIKDMPFAFGIYEEALYLIKPWLGGFKENPSSSDAEFAGEWGPIWTYTVDLTKVPASYPKQ